MELEDGGLPRFFLVTSRLMTEPFKGKIPAIAEKEKRGKRIKIPKNEIYVQELTTNASINIPTSN